MPVTARFTERIVGRVALVGTGEVSLPERGAVVGDDVVAAAREAAATRDAPTPGPEAPAWTGLDLTGLELHVDKALDARGGLRSAVVAGRVTGFGPEVDGPIVTGFADLLFSTAPGERRMYYRLVTGGADGTGRTGWYVVEGVKVVRGRLALSWAQTTTLYARVSELGGAAVGEAAAQDAGAAVVRVRPVAAGVLRILPGDLLRQGLSMRGAVPPFLLKFFRLLAHRR